MKTPDKNKVYDLRDLTDYEYKQLKKEDHAIRFTYTFFKNGKWDYCIATSAKTTNAKELFTDQTPDVGKKVEKPKHYANGIDTFARMEANCTKEECLAFAKGNIDKYNWREKGQDLEDFNKIISYAQWSIKLLTK